MIIEQTWLNPLWPLWKKLHNFLSFYSIDLKSSKKLQHEVMHHIEFRKLKTKSKQNRYKDLKHDLQVLLWMFNRFGFPTLTLFFSVLHKFYLHFPRTTMRVSTSPSTPFFHIFFSSTSALIIFLGVFFFFVEAVFFLMEHFSTFEEPHHLHLLQLNPLVFFSTILFSHFLLYLSNLYLQESC